MSVCVCVCVCDVCGVCLLCVGCVVCVWCVVCVCCVWCVVYVWCVWCVFVVCGVCGVCVVCVCVWCVWCVFVVCGVWCMCGVCVCILALAIRHANHISLTPYYVFCGLSACLSVSYFCTLSHTRRDFRKTCTEHKTCDVVFSTSSVGKISHFKKNATRYDNQFTWSSCKVISFRVKFYCNLIFSTDFRKILTYQM